MLERLLTHHPNQGFVDSVLVGLCKGFWPFADMMKEGYLKLWDGSWHPPKSEKEHDFLEEQVQTKIATKCFSELFRMELLLGMYSPLALWTQFGLNLYILHGEFSFLHVTY